MKKSIKLFSIVLTAVLTLGNLWQIIPNSVRFKKKVDMVLNPILSRTEISVGIGIIIILLSSVVIVTMIYELKNTRKIHTFSVGSKKFRDFFSKWYSQPGSLSIICDDLQGWLVTDGKEEILDALRRKSQRGELHLILGKEIPECIVDELKALGAIIHHAPGSIISNYSFSCISVMGNNADVIIRNKQMDERNMIKFEEISNAYVTGLLNVLIENIKGESE